jgi:KDO2-lipid IV(A) lauroyltransferase
VKKGLIEYWVIHPFWGCIDYLTFYILRFFSLHRVSNIGAKIGSLAKKRFRQACQDTLFNLEQLEPDNDAIANQRILEQMWQNIARSLTEMSVLDRFRLAEHVHENKLDIFHQLKRDKPVIFLFPHLGNWELLAISVINQGFKLNVMFETVPNLFQRKLLSSSRKRIGYDLITPDYRGTRKIFQVLKKGESIGLAMDEFKNDRIMAPVFNGHLPGRTNIHYAISLARHFNAPIVMGYCKRMENIRFEITYASPLDLNKSELQSQTNEAIAEIINEQCRQWVMENLEQWYMLHRAKVDK